MAIKSRFLISTALILLLTGLFSWLSMRVLAEGIIVNWVERYAEKQIQYDKVRTLLPLIQEVNRSKEFAELESLKAWAKQPFNEALKQQALEETEAFRHRFADKSYFIALKGNEHYYYSEGKEAPPPNLYRYTLHHTNPDDAWFYQIMAKKLNLHLNVNPDVELGVIKLWSDVLIRDGDDVLGVVGTGLDLSGFLQQMVAKQDIYSAIVFTNNEGSIQLYQREELIDYSSLTKLSQDKSRVFQLLDDEVSRTQLTQALALAKETPNHVKTSFVYKDDVRQLASIVYIPEIDWFQINFIDIKGFLPLTEFSSLLVVFFISLVCALIVFYLLLTLIVTKPLAELDLSIGSLDKKQYRAPKLTRFAGLEIKKLVSHYQKMSTSLLEHQQELEEKVAERTKELNRIARLDPLTELYNRRGFEAHMTEYMQRWQQSRHSFGLINVDVNHFKSVNDLYGHAAGDLVLQKIATYLKNTVGDKGEVARWGGDEFLILVKQDLAAISEQLQDDHESLVININEQDITIQFSVGSALVEDSDTLESLLHRADGVMYAAKFSHR
ncbi:diguanylate cyclase [Marinomonas rhizomae]|uniref:diguanylate cyclase n=1 Tax=Marinomonas rhizomae TaxID=491948 RepID=A0A366JA53_9GAMM|nr:GGDEF domain-containing protein [Marinomonas rhizomae]RBP83916.1 diguanylate cyclase (GGDEF)-like protein [Marinomonas rhizomae]RNF73380.1 diguanylate cyclase [Marinomonas rhizomae]